MVLRIWDTAGQEIYRGLAQMYCRSVTIVIIVYDITSTSSFESIDCWMKELRSNLQNSIVIVICGNKTDLNENRTTSQQTAQQYAEEHDALNCETNVVTGT
jgi:Rab family protein